MSETPNSTSIRDDFVSSIDGTTPFETILIILPSFFYTTVTTIILTLLNVHQISLNLQFILEFSMLVVPIVLNLTILPPFTTIILHLYLIILSSLVLFVWNIKRVIRHKPTGIVKERKFITNARSTVNLVSIVAILAVDFRCFPRRFAKTSNYGYSLMDLGVGLYIYSNGITDNLNTNFRKLLKTVIPLVLLGIGRLFITKEIDYHVSVQEYGLHWNFFLTLAITKIIVSLISWKISVKYAHLIACFLLVTHQFLLTNGLEQFVIDTYSRDGFIRANKEGLVSLPGYISIYLLSSYFSYYLNIKSTPNRLRTSFKFAAITVITLLLSIVLKDYFNISRKLANSSYCFWVLFIGIFMTFLFYLNEILYDSIICKKLFNCIYTPLIFDSINYNGLVFFLVGNLLTGFINIVIDTMQVDTVPSLIVILVYMLVNCLIICFLYRQQIRLKL